MTVEQAIEKWDMRRAWVNVHREPKAFAVYIYHACSQAFDDQEREVLLEAAFAVLKEDTVTHALKLENAFFIIERAVTEARK